MSVLKICLPLQRKRKNKRCNRNVAQLVAHYVRDVGVGRSSRLIPTEERQMILFCYPKFRITEVIQTKILSQLDFLLY